MINLLKEQNRAFNNVVRRDLPLDTPSMISHLKEEVKELERAGDMPNRLYSGNIENVRNNEEFLLSYKTYMKDSSTDELADIVITCMSIAESKSIDLESAIMIKQRVNGLRKD